MATQVAIEDLSTWLSNQPDNTIDTPYEVEITGLTVEDWETQKTTIHMALANYNSKYIDLSETILPVGITNLSRLFEESALVKSPAIPNTVTNMTATFGNCYYLKTAPIIPDSVTNMDSTFIGCSLLTTVSTISNNVTTMEDCFYNCTSLISAPIIPDSVENLFETFYNCSSLEEIRLGIEDFFFAGIQYYNYIFYNCTNLTSFVSDKPYELKTWLTNLYNASTDNFPNDPSSCNYSLLSSLVEFPINNLGNELSVLSANTTDTPFSIKITDLTTSNISSIRDALTSNNTKYVDLRETVLPSGITSLEGAFLRCLSLVYAPVIPDGVRNMMDTFSDCTALKESPLLPNSVLYLSECFFNCSSLTSVILPTNVTSLNATFYRCTSLVTAPAIPESAVLLEAAFYECTNLTDVTFKNNNFSNIDNYSYVFKGCTVLANCHTDRPYELKTWLTTLYNASTNNIPVNPNSLNYNFISSPIEIPVLSLGNELSAISANTVNTPFDITITELTTSNISSIKTALIANATKYVDLRTTVIPSGITQLQETFYNCATLVYSPTIPSGVEVMVHTFERCTSLKEAPSIPNSVLYMTDCFKNCSSLTSVTLPENVVTLEGTFGSCTSLITPPIIPSSVRNIRNCFYGCSSITTAPVIPEGVTNITGIFGSCTSLVSIANVIPSTITDITSAFSDCTSLESVETNLSDFSNIVSFDGVFSGCTSLTDFKSDYPYELKTWLTYIYNQTPTYPIEENIHNDPATCNFEFISSPIEIPVTSLGNELSAVSANTTSTPFYVIITGLDSTNYNSIKTALTANNTKYVDIHSTVLPSVTSLDNTFENCTTLIQAPETPNTVTSMQSTYSGCTNLSEIPDIPSSVTSLSGILSGCTSITEAPYLPRVTSYQNVFNGCTNLEDISNLDFTGATNLQNTFKNCSSLVDSPTIPNTTTNMEGTFNGCSALENAPRIPDSVINMESTFEGCSSLTAIQNVPANVTNLTNTFKNCTSLEEIDLFAVPISILSSNAENCFSGCTNLTNVGVDCVEPAESNQWHIFFLTFGADTLSGKVYSKIGNQITTQTISPITIDKSTLVLPIITDELWFPNGTYLDSEIETIIQRMITYQYGYFNSGVIPPDRKSFVLWADNKQNVVTNITSGGGGTNITVYNTEQDIIDDLPNLNDEDIVASRDDELGTIETILASAVPVGTILPYFGSSGTSVWLLCDGREFSAQQYPLLYQILGDNHTPDLRELVLRGAGHNEKYVFDSTETDPNTGLTGTQNHNEMQLGSFQDDALQSHTHSIEVRTGMDDCGNDGWGAWRYTSTGNTNNPSGRTDTTTHDKSFAVSYIIRGK